MALDIEVRKRYKRGRCRRTGRLSFLPSSSSLSSHQQRLLHIILKIAFLSQNFFSSLTIDSTCLAHLILCLQQHTHTPTQGQPHQCAIHIPISIDTTLLVSPYLHIHTQARAYTCPLSNLLDALLHHPARLTTSHTSIHHTNQPIASSTTHNGDLHTTVLRRVLRGSRDPHQGTLILLWLPERREHLLGLATRGQRRLGDLGGAVLRPRQQHRRLHHRDHGQQRQRLLLQQPPPPPAEPERRQQRPPQQRRRLLLPGRSQQRRQRQRRRLQRVHPGPVRRQLRPDPAGPELGRAGADVSFFSFLSPLFHHHHHHHH